MGTICSRRYAALCIGFSCRPMHGLTPSKRQSKPYRRYPSETSQDAEQQVAVSIHTYRAECASQELQPSADARRHPALKPLCPLNQYGHGQRPLAPLPGWEGAGGMGDLMGCDFPLKAYRSEELSSTGKRLLTFNPMRGVNSTSPMEIPCNNCMGCKLERSRQWSVRMMHESKLYDQNCFLTLTYSDQTVPQDYSLDLRHLQLFMKRLRKSLPQKIRFYACGEYGDKFGRPHYHAIIFNFDFPDKKFFKLINDKPHYTSETLTNLWQLGHCTIADVTPASCSYVARYVTKKIKANDEYGFGRYYRLSPIDGQMHFVKPEFAVMSRRPGIGRRYVEQFKSDFYPSGFIIVDGVKQAPPRYYVEQLSEEEQTELKRAARRKSLVFKPHTTTERRLARAAVRDARIAKLKRNLE